jgi:CCR4-NOT transcription complex subunit 3
MEIERAIKQIKLGYQEFDDIYEKIQTATSQPQKEKQEDNLKREIKKLQRQRDQIKTWIASGDVKDKSELIQHRKDIEKVLP